MIASASVGVVAFVGVVSAAALVDGVARHRRSAAIRRRLGRPAGVTVPVAPGQIVDLLSSLRLPEAGTPVGGRGWPGAIALVALAAGVLGGPLLGVVAGGALVAARVGLPQVARRRRIRAAEAGLPLLLERIANGLRAGRSTHQAVTEAARSIRDPLAAELAPFVGMAERGASLSEVLRRWAASTPTPTGRLTATALALTIEAGGPAADAIEGVAATARHRLALGREVRALASQARASAAVLIGLPVVFAVLASAADSSMREFLTATPLGLACVAAGLALDVGGALWMQRITRGLS